MALTYETAGVATGTVADVMDNLGGLNTETQDAIQAILNSTATKVDGEAQPVVQEFGATLPQGQTATLINIPKDANDGKPILIGDHDLNAPVIVAAADSPAIQGTFGADSKVDAVILSNANDNKVTFAADKPINVTMGSGDNNAVTTAGGNDVIAFNGGNNATVQAGTGNDTVTVAGTGTGSTISQDAGHDSDLTVVFNSSAIFDSKLPKIEITIDGGNGFDTLQMNNGTGDRAFHDFTFDTVKGMWMMHSNGEIGLKGMEVITYDTTPNEGNGVFSNNDQMTILSDSVNDTLVGRLYQIAFGRQPFDAVDAEGGQLSGIDFWMNDFYNAAGKTKDGYDQSDIQHLVYAFLNTKEFYDNFGKGAELGDVTTDPTAYVAALFDNLAEMNGGQAVAKVNGATQADFVKALENGDLNAFDVAWQIASSDEADDIMGADGNHYVIEHLSDQA